MTEPVSPFPVPKPNDAVFKTPHSTERNWRTASENLILLTEVGSNLHGTAIGSDDQDVQGVCIEPPEVMLGISQFELYEYRSQPVGVRSGPGDLDLNIYGMAKWVRLIVAGNPSHLLPLFAPASKIYASTWAGQELRDNRHLFLAKQHAQKFLGYLNRQRERMLGNLSQKSNRPELINAYGYDTKFAAHALRIAMQGIQLMKHGEIVLPMLPHARKYLIDVRNGRYTQGEVLRKLGALEYDLERAGTHSTVLQERVDTDYVNDWLVSAYERHWNEKKVPVIPPTFEVPEIPVIPFDSASTPE